MNGRRRPRAKALLQVYALVFDGPAKQVYVGQCMASDRNARQVYRLHIDGRYAATKVAMDAAVARRELPDMYALDRYEGYSGKSLTHVYAYAKYFSDHGFDVLMVGDGRDWLEDISEKSQEVLGRFKAAPIEEVLSEARVIVRDYQLREWSQPAAKPAGGPVKLTVNTTQENAGRIRKSAQDCGLSVSEYGEQMMLNGAVVVVDNGDINRSVNRVYKALYDLTASIKHFDGMYPAHRTELRRIEREVSELAAQVSGSAGKTVAAARSEAAKAVRRAARQASGQEAKAT